VIDNPKLSKGTENRYNKPTKREGLAWLIDEIFAPNPPKDFDDLLKQLEKSGCKIKRRGKTISVKPPDAERYFRFRAGAKGLPDGYNEASLRVKIAEVQVSIQVDLHEDLEIERGETVANVWDNAPVFSDVTTVEDIYFAPEADTQPIETMASPFAHDKKINLIIDLENSIKAQTSASYERWVQGFNLQQTAETLLFLQTNDLTDMDVLTRVASETQATYDTLQKRIDAADSRLKEVNTLQRHIGTYNKNRDVYSQYLRTKRDPNFRKANEKAIATVEEAKAYFDSLGLSALPTIKDLRAEYSVLSQEKHNCYTARNELRQHVFDL
jgi:hypothetical protein